MTRSADHETLSESIDSKLLEGLFNQLGTLVIGGSVPPIIAAICLYRTGLRVYLIWMVASVIVLAGRVALNTAFTKRRNRAPRCHQVWRRGFMAGACAGALPTGIAAALTIRVPDPFVQMLVISTLTALVMGFAARNAVYPASVYAFVALSEAPIFMACLFSHNIFYLVYMPIIVSFVASSVSVVRYQYGQIVRFLLSDEQNEALVKIVNTSNLELAQVNRQLAAMAATDGLTGLANRRSFDDELLKAVRAARRDGTDISVLMFDIDSFKAYNDRYGHQLGDRCLRSVATTLKSAIRRPADTMSRYGGEEFVAILPQTDVGGAAAFAEITRSAVEALGLEHEQSSVGVVTVSIGVATLAAGADRDGEELVRLADAALYEAKRAGRNRVNVAVEIKPDAMPEDVPASAQAAL